MWDGRTFQIRSGDRVQIEENNGAGKTTLLRIITGSLAPVHGKIVRSPFTDLYLDQDYTMINPNLTVYDQVQQYNSRHLQEHQVKSLMIYAQFGQDVFDRKCIGLSGGEKMKQSLCSLAVSNYTPDVLILDEPTNNLDAQSLKVLTAAVKNFNSTWLVISHDSHFTSEIGIDFTYEPVGNSKALFCIADQPAKAK